MALKPVEQFPAGGVDSRSNPIVMPADRCLEVHDFWPEQDGSYKLRDGYTLYANGFQQGVPIHSVVSVTQQPLPPGAPGSTVTDSAIIAPGPQGVEVAALFMSPGNYVVIDTGANQETVAVTHTNPLNRPPVFSATFTKPHAIGVPVVSVPGVVAGPPLVVFWQGTTPYLLNQLTNEVSLPLVKGAAIQSSSRFSYFYANGHLHAFNGTDAKWFDGLYWRDIGLPTLTAAQTAGIGFLVGIQAITPTQAAAVGMTFASGGGWVPDAGDQFCFAFFDTATNTLAASPILLASGAVMTGTAGQKLNFTNLPVSSVTTVVGLISILNASTIGARFIYDSSFGTGGLLNVSASSAVGTTVTLTIAAHGLSTGLVLVLNTPAGQPNLPSYGPFAVTVVDANNVSFQSSSAASFGSNACVGTALCLTGPARSTSFSLSVNTTWDSEQGQSFNAAGGNLLPYANDTTQIFGLAASSVGGNQPGYQFYASIYNLVTGHVGNRTPIGFRLNNTASVASVIFSGCPVFTDSEWVLLLGRTGDGAEIPYAVIDQNANWQYVPNGQTSFTLLPVSIDGSSELPSRNYPPPGTLDCNYQYSLLPGGAAQNPPITGTFVSAWMESDHMCGVLSGSATIYRSGSALDMREGVFVGLPEQSWDPADIETFPTNNPVVAGHGYQQESWCFTRQDCGMLMELAGQTSWQGPYNIGSAGQHAWARGWQNLPFWVTGEKQLATVSLGGWQQLAGMTSSANAGPIIVSTEYEAALLSQIGNSYLSQTEVCYIRQPLKMVEVLRIKCYDVNGNPFTIIHDFNLRDERSPYGQAYEEIFGNVLGSAFTQEVIRDVNEKPQVVCGGSDGNLYLLYSGGNDNGTEFTAQALRLLDLGPQRTAVKWLEWYGDKNAHFFISRNLSIPFNIEEMDDLCQEAPMEVQGEEGNSRWEVDIPHPEMVHAYLLLQLTSHSADGTTTLNNPPHMPVETYGRIWLVAPQLGAARPR